MAASIALTLAAPASATTFCVPNFHAACPNNGTNVAQANLETAMQSNSVDGVADTIVIDAGTRTDTDSFNTAGTDPLEIVGAGPGTSPAATRLTTSTGSNIFVVNLNPGPRPVTMRELTVVIPSSIPASGGVGVQATQDTLENVDIESQGFNHSTGISISGGSSFDGGSIYGIGGGGLITGIDTGVTPGPLALDRLTISNATFGVQARDAGVPVTLRRSRINGPSQTGVDVSQDGAEVTVENSVITDPGSTGILVNSNTASSPSAIVRHTTIARVAGPVGADPLSARVQNGVGNGDASLTATGMIIRGFTDSYRREAPVLVTVGDATLSLGYSNFVPMGTDSGDGALTLEAGNIDANPLFASLSDFHLLSGSPSIDAADPAPAVAVNEDFDGAVRPTDGNGDGVARRDMGAFELQPPAGTPPAAGPTGQRAAALKKCKKKKRKARKKCRKRAKKLPV